MKSGGPRRGGERGARGNEGGVDGVLVLLTAKKRRVVLIGIPNGHGNRVRVLRGKIEVGNTLGHIRAAAQETVR